MSLTTKAAHIRLLLFDVDGVLTDGRILLHADGTESKQFEIKDGTGIVLAQRAGLTVGFLSARMSAATHQRATQLGVTLVHQGVSSKIETYGQIVDALLLEDEQVAYMGDDIVDLPVLARVGLATAPSDAAPDVRSRVHWVSQAGGGAGAARELVELILRAQNKWESLVAEYEFQRYETERHEPQRRSVLDTTERSVRGSSERETASEASGGGAPRAAKDVPHAQKK